MNGKDTRNEQLEKLLGKARLHDPSPLLRERVTTEAKKTWNQAPPEVPWWIPARRLVASVAAALLVIWLANVTSDYSVVRWKTSGSSEMHQQFPELEILPEMSCVKHLTSINRGFPITGASGLREYVETLRRLLDEASQNDVSNPPDPINGRSRLPPDRSGSSSYS